MNDRSSEPAYHTWRPHPWHGLSPGDDCPNVVRTFVEITPFDYVKYEVDKETGYMMVDRPQRTSAQPPTLYGFVPQTYCGERVKQLSEGADAGDGDPLDICIISERRIDRGAILLDARVLGGLRMLDGGEADDKIIAVLKNDYVWSNANDVTDLPDVLIQRIKHYFGTYKMGADMVNPMEIKDVFGRAEAHKLIIASLEDYEERFGGHRRAWEAASRGIAQPGFR